MLRDHARIYIGATRGYIGVTNEADQSVAIELLPSGGKILTARGASLHDILFERGLEFPCGGRGECGRCAVRIVDGIVPISNADRRVFTRGQLREGLRAACQITVSGPVTIELPAGPGPILADTSAVPFTPQKGYGVAIDLGTTTVVAQVMDLSKGQVLVTGCAMNPQARFGSDVMTRIHREMTDGGHGLLTDVIRRRIGGLIVDTAARARIHTTNLTRIVVVGNTVMHHFLCGIDVEPLSHHPFKPTEVTGRCISPSEMGWGWGLGDDAVVHVMPLLGGFVGSDILAGIVATSLNKEGAPRALIDLGTNGEIVISADDRILCASTAAGPAFEGGEISMGMRAKTGAIHAVRPSAGGLTCRVLGGGPAIGICGSGLVDAIAAGLELGLVEASGRLGNRAKAFPLADSVTLTQEDVRKFQLAKASVAAGFDSLLARMGLRRHDLEVVYLAGAFGNYVSPRSADRTGLLSMSPLRTKPIGNSALLGAKMLLCAAEPDECGARLAERVEHVTLIDDKAFEDAYVSHMAFPPTHAGEQERWTAL